jgi:hypothetical protein
MVSPAHVDGISSSACSCFSRQHCCEVTEASVLPNRSAQVLTSPSCVGGGQEDSRGAAPSILGPSILIASRLGAYTLASWGLLAADVSANNVQDGAAEPPFHRFCDALKILLRYHILLAVRVRPDSASLVIPKCRHGLKV